jgi:hypothetical protein
MRTLTRHLPQLLRRGSLIHPMAAASLAPVRATHRRACIWIEGTLGVFFTFFAFKLATDRS